MKAGDGTDLGRPIDRVAARVIGKGVHYQPDFNPTGEHSEVPIRTIPISKGEKDLTGLKFGNMIVTGKFWLRGSTKKKCRWVVRCVCGKYETRRSCYIARQAKSIERDRFDKCQECEYKHNMKRKEEYYRKGYNMEDLK